MASWVRLNRAFGKAVCAQDWGRADSVYAFNGAAVEIFERARSEGRLCILDQTAAPWRFNSTLLERESSVWPGWESSPADRDLDGRMVAREEAEWELADRIVCGSPFVVEAVRAVGGPAHKCRVVPYPTPIVPAQSSRGRRHGSPLRVLFVGTLQLRKGIQYVWDVAGRLKGDGFEFRAVGPSDLSPSAEADVGARMEFLGRVARDEVWSHYLWADVFLLPTLSEGSANVCWEALASGTRVVTTRAAGVDPALVEIVEADTNVIMSALRRLAAEPSGQPFKAGEVRSSGDYGRDLMNAVLC